VAISGKENELARARAAIADRLTHAPAYLTMSEEAEKVEDRLGAVAASNAPLAERLGQLKEIDSTLAALTVPFDEWETLYRERLQIERDILASAVGTESGPPGVPGASGTTEAAEIPGGVAADRLSGNGPAVVTGALMAMMVGYGISQLVDRIVGGRDDNRREQRPNAG
jgi:hypothetical protein